MELNLKGKTVLVTGSSSGIGKQIAKAFYDEGCNVVLNGRDEKKLLQTFSEFPDRVSSISGDVTDPDSCKHILNHVIQTWKQLDILVCNVGNGNSVPQGEEELNEWKKVFSENFFSTTNMVELCKSELSKTHGSIVCISSISGIEYTHAPLTYSIAKGALNQYVKGIARVLAKDGIRINAIAPGNILFENSVWDKKLKVTPDVVSNMLKNEVALNRLGTPTEISNFAIFLSSDLASFATGSIFVVDGGQVRS